MKKAPKAGGPPRGRGDKNADPAVIPDVDSLKKGPDAAEKSDDISFAFQFQKYMDPNQNPSNHVFLNTAGQSIVPYNVEAEAIIWLNKQATPWNDFPETDELPLREEFTHLLPGSKCNEIAISHAASTHFSTVAWNLRERWAKEDIDFRSANKPVPQREILILEDDYTSNVYPWQMLVAEKLAKFVVVPHSDDWTQALLRIYEERKRTIKLAPLMQNLWTDGSWLDLEQIVPKLLPSCILTLDLTQSMGVIPVSESTVSRADAIVATTHKWLCGLYGLSLMYVNSRSDRITPRNSSGQKNYMLPLDFHERNRLGCVDGKCLPFLVKHRDDDAGGTPPSPLRFHFAGGGPKRRRVGNLADDAKMSIVPAYKPTASVSSSPGSGSKNKKQERTVFVEPIITSEALYENEWKDGTGVRLDIGGRPGNPILLPALVEALRLINSKWRPVNIKAHCERLMQQLKSELSDLNAEIRKKIIESSAGTSASASSKRQSSASDSENKSDSYLQLMWPQSHAPHIVGLKVCSVTEEPNGKKRFKPLDNTKVYERLRMSNIITSYRSNNIRVAIYVYNSAMDIARFVRCLKVYLFDECSIH